MAVWRHRALTLFPELRPDLMYRSYNVYWLFFELLPMARKAFDSNDTTMLRRIFGFAEWCAGQTAKDLWNSAGVAFYEHLFDRPAYSERVVKWLSPRVVYTHWELWEYMVSRAEWARVAPWLEEKRAVGERQVRLAKRRSRR